MSPTLDDQYLEWLYSQVAPVSSKNPANTRWGLFKQLYTKEFIWTVPNDVNRIEDAKELRQEFLNETGNTQVDPAWFDLGCSMLELLIVLSRMGSFQTGEPEEVWFERMVNNANLVIHTDDRFSDADYNENDDILDTIIHRLYEPDGSGGFFPLERYTVDQRNVELWYQLSAWVLQNHVI